MRLLINWQQVCQLGTPRLPARVSTARQSCQRQVVGSGKGSVFLASGVHSAAKHRSLLAAGGAPFQLEAPYASPLSEHQRLMAGDVPYRNAFLSVAKVLQTHTHTPAPA